MIWSPFETPPLTGTHHHNDHGDWWYCNNEFLTIQFLRSGLQNNETSLFTGRLAFATDNGEALLHEPSAPSIEKRFKRLKRFVKAKYENDTIIWQNISLPRSKTNPGKPAANLWIGPHALRWLREAPKERWVQVFRGTGASGFILDLVP